MIKIGTKVRISGDLILENINHEKTYIVMLIEKVYSGIYNVNGDENNTIPASLTYPASEDIYNKGNKVTNEEEELWNENSFSKVGSSNGLDVPGSELDDRQESIGSEDEENNYYSLGGDGHNDLEEDKG